MRGPIALIIAISPCADLLPALSIMSAALRHNSRIISRFERASATRCSQIEWSAMRLPKATRLSSRLHISSSAASATPIDRMQ